jgi:GTPase SAR1 family protein
MADTTNKIIRRKSIGRAAFIGSLYNAMSDTFCGTAILKEKFPNDSLSKIDIPNSELLYEYEDSYVEKFNKLDVDAELKLSVLAGFFTLEGSGKYLSDVKDSSRTVKGNLIYRMTTIEENLNIYRDDVKACISTDGLSNTVATHIVIGIKWGATVIASYECKNMNEDDKHQVEVTLKSYFERLSLSTSGSDNVENNQLNLMNNFSIKFLGDAIPQNKTFLQSCDEARKVLTELPSYVIQFNNGKGFPIEYILYPLSELAKLLAQNTTINSMIIESGEEIVLKVEQVFDDLFKSKQRLNDLFNDAKYISNLIPDNIFDDINDYVQEFKLEMTKFRKKLAGSLVKIRSRKGNIDELEDIMTTFQKGVLSKNSIMAFIDRYRSVSTKADLVLTLKTKEVEYLGKNSTIEHILRRSTISHIYKLIDEDIINGNSSPVQSVNSNEKSSKSSVAKPKIRPEVKSPGYPIINHVSEKLENNDYFNDNKILFTSNFIKFDISNLKPKYDLNEKMRLAIPCPYVDCPPTICNWKCFKCEQDIEYGYNKYFYCNCGEIEITNCKFKCNSLYHNVGYVSFESNTLINLLPSAPPEEINVLLLGGTGVGKSTFINAFVNYLKFDTLDDAKAGNMEVLISSKFTITDCNYETKTIKIGNDDSNERLKNIGMSSTQECKSYVFQAAENKVVRLIDVPSIDENNDKKKFENILKYISYYRYLNGICILLKPNEPRLLNVTFKFCIQELLLHLHRNAKDNIIFCFTNARGTFYRPGDTLPPLKKQLRDLKERSGVEIKTNQDTIYCFDNESFRFLAAIKKGILYTETDEQNFAGSWKKSVNESLRLIEYLVTRPPHAVKDTLSLNNSRNIVVLLSKPLAEIRQLIQTNIKLIKEQQNEIANSNQTIEELKDQLYIPQIDLEPVTLGYPRTVCASIGCVRSLRIDQTNISKIDYITHCHPHCYDLDGVTCNQVVNPALRRCQVMNPDGNCSNCGCKWDKHMHITYENKQVTKKIIDQNVVLQISKKKSDQETKIAIIEDYQRRVNQLQIEQHTINEISLKFAQFLRQNAIAAFNDAYADYLDHFIIEEKIKKSADPSRYDDDEIFKGLEATKRSYLEQIEVIRKAIENNDPSTPTISTNDIVKLEQQLYNLPINGHTLKKIKDKSDLCVQI